MKLVSFTTLGRASFGILGDDGIVDVGATLSDDGTTLRSLLGQPERLADFAGHGSVLPVDQVELLPPVPDAGRVLCVGLNYRSHIAETGRDTPAYPMLFPRYPDSLVGGGQPMVRPSVSEKFDYEGEFAFVIGRGGRHISREAAMEHVAGFACFNDGSIRDFQRHTSQFLPGKNFWRSGSFGPWLVTPDEAGPVADLELVTRLNGREVQRARLDDLLFGVADLVAYISTFLPLMPGDVVATGTTGGVGAFHEPPLWMKAGDKVEVEITRLGTLRNTIIEEEMGHGPEADAPGTAQRTRDHP